MCSLPTAISCTVRVSKIPYTAVAEELVEFLNTSIGSNSVFACKIHTEKLNWKSRGFGFVQFETEEAASKAVELSRKCKLRFQQGLLQMEYEHTQIVDRPQIRAHCSSLYMGCLVTASNVFCALWSSKTALTIELDCVKGKLTLFLDSIVSEKKYKLTWKLTSLNISGTQKEIEKPNGNFFLLLQAKYAPKIHRKIAESSLKRGRDFMSDRYSFFRDNPEDQEHPWHRCTDFTQNRCIEHSSSYCLEVSAAEERSYDLFTKRLLSIQAFEVLKDISLQMGGDVAHSQDRSPKKSVVSKLNEGLMQVNRLTITPTKIYSLGPEVEVSNRVTRHYKDSMEDFIRVHFTDEDMSSLSARALEISPDKFLKSRVRSERTEIYHRIHKILAEGIELSGKKFEFLAFSSSQLREHSVWMFASGGTTTADSIRLWMGNFTNFKNVASCAARMGQCFSASKKGPDVHEYEIEEIPDVEVRSGEIKYCFSDGIGKISLTFAREVAAKCGYKSRGRKAPSAFQIRYGGYKGVVAIDPPSSYKLSLRPSMRKFQSKLISLDVLEWTRFLPCYLNRQIITLLSTLGVEDGVFELMQKERISSLDGVLLNEDAALRMLQTSCGGEYHKAAVEMLLAGYHPGDEPFLYSMLQAFKAVQIRQICKKSKILVPKGRVLMGCLDETASLDYGEVFVKISMADVKDDRETVIQGKVVVAKNPCLHPGDIRVLQAVDSPNLQHMVDCIVFPQKGSRPHPNECSGSDLDGDLYFVTWDEKLIPPTVEMPMDYYPPNTISLDHVPSLKEIQSYFVDYMSNDSLGTIANAHVVFADKEPEKARSWQCKELAELASIAVDFPKTGVPAILPKYLRPHSYPDFLEKTNKKTYISSGIIGKLHRAAKEASTADALGRCTKNFDEFYDKDLVVKGLEKYVEKAIVYKKLYDEKLTTLMEFYGVSSEAEMITGFFSELRPTMSNTSKKVEDRIQEAVLALQTEAKFWFQGMQVDGDANEEYAVASAWYHVTYHPDFLHESSCSLTNKALPLFSFPWVNHVRLLQIKRCNKLVIDI